MMLIIAKGLIGLGMLLLALGLLPLFAVMVLLTDIDPLIPFLLSLSVAPVGGLSLLVGMMLWLAERLWTWRAAG